MKHSTACQAGLTLPEKSSDFSQPCSMSAQSEGGFAVAAY
jgi:hypothetical protein